MRTVVLLTALLLSLPAIAQEAADLVEAKIAAAFSEERSAKDVLTRIHQLTQMIATADVAPEVKDALTERVGKKAFAMTSDPLALTAGLLALPDPALRDLAWQELLNDGRAIADKRVRTEMLRLVQDDRTSAGERGAMVFLFALHGRFAGIEPVALALVRNHAQPELAHHVAKALIYGLESDAPALAKVEAWDARAIREELAERDETCAGDATGTSLLLQIAEDPAEPVWVRGDAIRALGGCPDRPANQAALVELLDPSHWFSGAPGNHFPVHSLGLIVESLARSKDPAIRARLAALAPDVALLRSGEREYVEWLLERIVGCP